MEIIYKNNKVKKYCTSFSLAKKKFPEKIALKLIKLINYIESSQSLNDIISFPKYHFHDLKGDKLGLYSLDIDGRKTSYRLIVSFSSINKNDIFAKATMIEVIEIQEVSNHYE